MNIRRRAERPLTELKYWAERTAAHRLTNRSAVHFKTSVTAAAIPCDLGVRRGPAIMALNCRLMRSPTRIVRDRVSVQIQCDSRGIDCKTPNSAGDIVRKIVSAGLRQIAASRQLRASRIRHRSS